MAVHHLHHLHYHHFYLLLLVQSFILALTLGTSANPFRQDLVSGVHGNGNSHPWEIPIPMGEYFWDTNGNGNSIFYKIPTGSVNSLLIFAQ